MYLTKTPSIIKPLFKDLVWSFPNKKNTLFLTFDDGPKPSSTPWILDILDDFSAKATFFCVGANVEKYPAAYSDILNRGHKTGNHTYNHLSGWKTMDKIYFSNIEKCRRCVDSELFRPPYGRIKKSQLKHLKRKYKVIMWDVLSGDFDKNISKEKCLDNVLKNASHGSIIVMHDSIKGSEKMKYALPLVLQHFSEKGFRFEAIN